VLESGSVASPAEFVRARAYVPFVAHARSRPTGPPLDTFTVTEAVPNGSEAGATP
jgi:hypothetical protein